MTKPRSVAEPLQTHDTFVPDRQVRAELAVSHMTLARWDRDPAMVELGWPPPVRLGGGDVGRKHRYRRQLEIFKTNLVRRAIAERGKVA